MRKTTIFTVGILCGLGLWAISGGAQAESCTGKTITETGTSPSVSWNPSAGTTPELFKDAPSGQYLSASVTDYDKYNDPFDCLDTSQSFEWTVDGSSTVVSTASSYTFPSSSSLGTHSVKCKVTDANDMESGSNWTRSNTWSVIVKGLTKISASPTSVHTGESVTLTAEGTFGNDVSTALSWDCGRTGNNATISWSSPCIVDIKATYGNTVGPVTVTVYGYLNGLTGPKSVKNGDQVTFSAQGVFGTGSNVPKVTWTGLPTGATYSGDADQSATATFTSGTSISVSATYDGVTKTVSYTGCQGCCCDGCTALTPCYWYNPSLGVDCEAQF